MINYRYNSIGKNNDKVKVFNNDTVAIFVCSLLVSKFLCNSKWPMQKK